MRINELFGGTQNGTTGINNDLSLIDIAENNDNRKTASPLDKNKGAVGFFNSAETGRIGGNHYTYTFNEAKGKENDDLASKIKNGIETGINNDKELVKNLTGDDYDMLQEEGMSVEKFSKERLEKAIERIKENRKVQDIRLEESIEKQQDFKETIERMSVYSQIESGTDKLIAKMLYEADIPVTEENIEEIKQAAGKAEEALKLTDSSKGYLIKNNLQPTIENLYKAAHSGEMRTVKIDDSAWNQLKIKASEIADTAQNKLNPDNPGSSSAELKNARWLIEHDIPLTAENLIYKSELDGLTESGLDSDTEQLFKIAAEAMREGLPAETGILTGKDRGEISEETEEIAAVMNEASRITDMAIKLAVNGSTDIDEISLEELSDANKTVEADKGSGVLSAGLSEELTVKEVKVKIRLEEVRLSMNFEAGRRLMAKGINIMSDSLLRVTEGIRELEKEYIRDLFKEIGADNEGTGAVKEASDSEVELALRTNESLKTISGSSIELYRMTFSIRHSITLGELAETGSRLTEEAIASGKEEQIQINPSSMKAAVKGYEDSATEIRKDLGDSIKKAFSGSVDSLLNSNGLEITEANRRAVRILGYNSMEITSESITEIKYYDAKVTGIIDKMTPPVVLDMIRNGINPLDMSIDELDSKLTSLLREQGTSKEQSYGAFLVKMEESRQIGENERNAYIGVYRLLYNISKNDGAALGAALNSGKELSLRNLMTEVRSFSMDIDLKIDDNIGQKNSHYNNSVTGQIDEAFIYQNSLLENSLKVTEPSAWSSALSGKDLGMVTLENLSEGLQNYEGINNSIERAREIADVMMTDSPETMFLNSFGIKDSFLNRNAAGEILSGRVGEDTAVSVSPEELEEALVSRSKTDELLGIKTRMANALTGQAFRTAINAQSAAELNARVERIEMLQKLAGKGHYRFNVEDENESKQINLTFIRNSGNSGTVSVQISKPDYNIQADLNMVIMDAKYNGPSVNGMVYLNPVNGTDSQMKPETDKSIGALKDKLEEAGITIEGLSVSATGRSREAYISHLSQIKSKAAEEETEKNADQLYIAAGAIVTAF